MPRACVVSRFLRQSGCSGYAVWGTVDGFVSVKSALAGDPTVQLQWFAAVLAVKYHVRPDPLLGHLLLVSDI